jgi:hypothetical protein
VSYRTISCQYAAFSVQALVILESQKVVASPQLSSPEFFKELISLRFSDSFYVAKLVSLRCYSMHFKTG